MIQVAENVSHSEELEHSGEVLSESVIPAVQGEFYSYSSRFTEKRPLYALMKCKANKDRRLETAIELGNECNLVFLFGKHPHICSIRAAHSSGLLDESIIDGLFGETWIAATKITAEDFYELRSQKNVATLVEICQTACSTRGVSIALKRGDTIAMMTDGGKYGLFLVKEATPNSIQIDACHILL